jgi:hypothetical protein
MALKLHISRSYTVVLGEVVNHMLVGVGLVNSGNNLISKTKGYSTNWDPSAFRLFDKSIKISLNENIRRKGNIIFIRGSESYFPDSFIDLNSNKVTETRRLGEKELEGFVTEGEVIFSNKVYS